MFSVRIEKGGAHDEGEQRAGDKRAEEDGEISEHGGISGCVLGKW